MNNQNILSQLHLVYKSVDRAKVPFEIDLVRDETIKVTVYELLKSQKQIEFILNDIYDAFPHILKTNLIDNEQ